jgi:hypothetical protein
MSENLKLQSGKEKLQGWIPGLADEAEVREALEKAFDYRGDITLTLKNGSVIEGYIFDRKSGGPALADCLVRLLPKDRDERVSVRYSEIARIEFSGRDTAEGKSFEAWVRKYRDKKARGEKNISLAPEPLD